MLNFSAKDTKLLQDGTVVSRVDLLLVIHCLSVILSVFLSSNLCSLFLIRF
jgi:hypothetical protein